MIKISFGRIARMGRLSMVMVFVASLATLASASSALATPTGEYSVFAECPFSKVTPQGACLWARTESGKFVIGKETVPITNPITLQGGLTENAREETTFYPANIEGNTLSKSPQKVPGGLTGLVKCDEITGEGAHERELRKHCEEIFENKITGVNATAEIAGSPKAIQLNELFLFAEFGTALLLPVKIHLENPLFGNECYLGSNSSPIDLELTTGTTAPPEPNKPIKGKLATSITSNEEGTILTIGGNTLVNNSYAVPGASGCGLFGLLDGIVNARLGAPSTAGHNTVELNGTLKQATATIVQEH